MCSQDKAGPSRACFVFANTFDLRLYTRYNTNMGTHDIIIGSCQWVLVLALLFSIWGRERMYITGPITAVALTVMAGTFVSMEFWNATAACGSAALCWYCIAARAVHKHFKKTELPVGVIPYRVKISTERKQPWVL